MFAIGDVMENINDALYGNPDIIFGTTTDENLAIDEIKITIVATGFESADEREEQEAEQAHAQKVSSHVNTRANEEENHYDLPPLMRGYSIKFNL